MDKRGLGKGLDALLGGMLPTVGAPRELPVTSIVPNPYQPRKTFGEEALNDLVASIREHGILQPILVRQVGAGRYELIAGERRFRAAQAAGLTSVPVVLRDCPEDRMLEVALIENIQREDINPVEAARAYRRLIDEFGLTQEEISKRVGKARSTIANTLRLLGLPPEMLESVSQGVITEAHARHILQAAEEDRSMMWKTIVARGLTVRAAQELGEQMARQREGVRPPKQEHQPREYKDPNLADVADQLSTLLGTKVDVRMRGKVGVVEIEFYSHDHLDSIFEKLTAAPPG